jgi:hypothetical protein
MEKRHDFLSWIMDGREKNQWEYDATVPYFSLKSDD